MSDYTPLSLAASGGYVDIVIMLLDAGAEINSRTGSKVSVSCLVGVCGILEDTGCQRGPNNCHRPGLGFCGFSETLSFFLFFFYRI